MTVQNYRRPDGSEPFRVWFEGLSSQAASRVQTALSRLEIGNTSNVKWFAGIGEIRIDSGPGYRVYLLRDGNTLILLLGGGTKRRQGADVENALRLRDEWRTEESKKKRKHPESRKDNA